MCLVTQSCLTLLGDPIDCSLQGSSVQGNFQAIILEWVAISFSRGSSWHRDRTHISCLAGWLFTMEPPGKPMFFLYLMTLNTTTYFFCIIWDGTWFHYFSQLHNLKIGTVFSMIVLNCYYLNRLFQRFFTHLKKVSWNLIL